MGCGRTLAGVEDEVCWHCMSLVVLFMLSGVGI